MLKPIAEITCTQCLGVLSKVRKWKGARKLAGCVASGCRAVKVAPKTVSRNLRIKAGRLASAQRNDILLVLQLIPSADPQVTR